jgi:hypothetical protein
MKSRKNHPVHLAELILYNKKTAAILWFGFAFFAFVEAIQFKHLNNYFIYEQVFVHMEKGWSLYKPYPAEYYDVNLYGPLFALLIAPFTWLPRNADVFCWIMANALLLFYAVNKLPVNSKWKAAILVLSAHELWVSVSWVQINPVICACILLSFSAMHKDKPGKAAFFILLGTFIKLYAITGLAFFFFTRRKIKFVLMFFLYAAVMFFLPLLITNIHFLLQSYNEWFYALKEKATLNISLDVPTVLYQNISVMGMIRRIFHLREFNDNYVLVPAMILFFSQYLSYKYFNDLRLRLYLLCSVLITTVIFSTSAESTTYILAVPAICLWWLMQPPSRTANIFFWTTWILTTLAYTDLLGRWTRTQLYHPYSLKALPCFILWLVIIVQIHSRQFLEARYPFKLQPVESAE